MAEPSSFSETARPVTVVSNTSPISYLVLIGEEDLLPALYGHVLIPEAVRQELSHTEGPRARPRVDAVFSFMDHDTRGALRGPTSAFTPQWRGGPDAPRSGRAGRHPAGREGGRRASPHRRTSRPGRGPQSWTDGDRNDRCARSSRQERTCRCCSGRQSPTRHHVSRLIRPVSLVARPAGVEWGVDALPQMN